MPLLTYLQKYVLVKDGHVKVVNMITKINEAKTLVKKLHVMISKYSIVKHVIQIKNEVMINVHVR